MDIMIFSTLPDNRQLLLVLGFAKVIWFRESVSHNPNNNFYVMRHKLTDTVKWPAMYVTIFAVPLFFYFMDDTCVSNSLLRLITAFTYIYLVDQESLYFVLDSTLDRSVAGSMPHFCWEGSTFQSYSRMKMTFFPVWLCRTYTSHYKLVPVVPCPLNFLVLDCVHGHKPLERDAKTITCQSFSLTL